MCTRQDGKEQGVARSLRESRLQGHVWKHLGKSEAGLGEQGVAPSRERGLYGQPLPDVGLGILPGPGMGVLLLSPSSQDGATGGKGI